ncbi:cell division protein FtsQ/DivIB [Geomesophilobacter sediminis]|uniref:Cell division protein FtsQ n=1 Tax=Geomesophilobacter sediminis TaxID=2798584 RepID=A0A8J7M127_9BACT|nr:FtsQ-type POTRA domain-containing protein [Geomesophilobacter sediminis]MBJ6726672.1 FtsQ-type POTRA domain-containing protein [Geomesophilobacter sediminis]
MRDLHPRTRRQVPVNRVKKPPKERKPINWRPIIKGASKFVGGAALFAATGFGGMKLYRLIGVSNLLRLETIEVSPMRKLTRNEVVTLAGIKPGDPLYRISLKGVVDQLSRNPWIEQVHVRRYYPHTLSISLTEREPKAVANVGCLYYLDAKANLFKALAEGDRLDYPLVTGVSEEDLTKDPNGSRDAFLGALQVVDQLKAGTVFGLTDVSEIHYDKGYGYTLFTMQGGVPVKLGNGGFSEKLARFASIYKELQPQMHALDYVDLDYSDKIIVKKG